MTLATNSAWGKQSGAASKRWSLNAIDGGFRLTSSAGTADFLGETVSALRVRRGLLSGSLLVSGDGPRRLRGLGRAGATTLSTALRQHLVHHQVAGFLRDAVAWHARVDRQVRQTHDAGRWVTLETLRACEADRPSVDPGTWEDGRHELVLSDHEHAAVLAVGADLRAWVEQLNEAHTQRELIECKPLLDEVESSPLTEEQARAVLCFDNRVHVIASAGSGKTSVMVARAAYALHRGLVPADQILLLAFNLAAAEELQARIDARLTAVGIDSAGVRASTFHAFGLQVLGRATGRKPRVAPWVEAGKDGQVLQELVDELRDSSFEFRFSWDLFRLLYSRVSDTPEGGETDGWDRKKARTGYTTFKGEVVKSQGERLIADFLFLQGVDYAYEKPYVHDVATAEHSQYQPDFYYPDIEVWHEHWALDHDGNPPDDFHGYAESMIWKRDLHAQMGTTLVETTWSEIMSPSGLTRLQGDLEELGLEMDWNPDRRVAGPPAMKHEELVRLVRTFMTHVKSGSLTPEDLRQRCAAQGATPRTQLFLRLYWPIHDAWQARLVAGGYVDFEDMLVQAAVALEDARYDSPYALVMVDEFQDASRARARMARALVQQPGRHLLAVGDDWQSINRFAGADLSVMTGFEEWFGPAKTLRLQTTFRCPQTLCDVSSSFVSRNPHQLRKEVVSAHGSAGAPVRMLHAGSVQEISGAIADYLNAVSHEVVADRWRQRDVTVTVLGRYGFDRDHLPRGSWPGLAVSFRTIHSAKGLEADYVIVPNLMTGKYGFPSQIADDPVLDLAMAVREDFPHAEERRLLYVALTRARREAVLLVVQGRESTFAVELLQDAHVVLDAADVDDEPPRVCHECGEGVLVSRKGKYGDFFGCSRFPACRGTANS